MRGSGFIGLRVADNFKSRKPNMKKTEIEISTETVAHELRTLFLESLEALLNPLVMEQVILFRESNPQFKYDSRTLASLAVNELRSIIQQNEASSKSLPLPNNSNGEHASSGATHLPLPLPHWFNK